MYVVLDPREGVDCGGVSLISQPGQRVESVGFLPSKTLEVVW